MTMIPPKIKKLPGLRKPQSGNVKQPKQAQTSNTLYQQGKMVR